MAKNILGVDIDHIIKSVLSETFFGEDEKKRQDAKSEELKVFKSKNVGQKKENQEEIDEDENSEKNKTSVKASEVVLLYNQMRSGRSLKDKEIRKNFQAYFDSLSGSERVALYSFSKAIADIISGASDEKESADEVQPEDFGVEVSKAPEKTKTKTVKKTKKDDSSPIVVGESADKSKELMLLRNLK